MLHKKRRLMIKRPSHELLLRFACPYCNKLKMILSNFTKFACCESVAELIFPVILRLGDCVIIAPLPVIVRPDRTIQKTFIGFLIIYFSCHCERSEAISLFRLPQPFHYFIMVK